MLRIRRQLRRGVANLHQQTYSRVSSSNWLYLLGRPKAFLILLRSLCVLRINVSNSELFFLSRLVFI